MNNNNVFAEKLRNKSTEKNLGSSRDSNPRSPEYYSDALTTKPFGSKLKGEKCCYDIIDLHVL